MALFRRKKKAIEELAPVVVAPKPTVAERRYPKADPELAREIYRVKKQRTRARTSLANARAANQTKSVADLTAKIEGLTTELGNLVAATKGR